MPWAPASFPLWASGRYRKQARNLATSHLPTLLHSLPKDTGYLRSTSHPSVWPAPIQKHVQTYNKSSRHHGHDFLSRKRANKFPHATGSQECRRGPSPCSDAMNSYTSSTLQRLGLLDRKTGLMPCRSGVGGAMLEFARSLSP